MKQYARMQSYFAETNASRDKIQRENLGKLSEAGVKIATGTDAGNIGTLHTASYF